MLRSLVSAKCLRKGRVLSVNFYLIYLHCLSSYSNALLTCNLIMFLRITIFSHSSIVVLQHLSTTEETPFTFNSRVSLNSHLNLQTAEKSEHKKELKISLLPQQHCYENKVFILFSFSQSSFHITWMYIKKTKTTFYS